jgi:AbrB family looped-hinge helix DNA binding protein
MAIAHSKLTSQGQISIPLSVRRKLGVGPGSIVEWEDDQGKMVVRRAVRYSSEEIHRALFPKRQPRAHTLEQMKEGIRKYVRKRHASS